MHQSDKFSITRLIKTAKFYAPPSGRQALIYCCLSILLGSICLISATTGKIIILLPFSAFMFFMLLSFGPLVFSFYKSQEFEIMLPASAIEKTIVKCLHSFVVLPLTLLIPFSILMMTGQEIMADSRQDISAFFQMTKTILTYTAISQLLETLFVIAVCLLGISVFKQKRVLYTVCAVIASYLAVGLVNAAGAWLALKGLYANGTIGRTVYSVDNNIQLFSDISRLITQNNDLIGDFSKYGTCVNTIFAITIFLSLLAIYHIIRDKQI